MPDKGIPYSQAVCDVVRTADEPMTFAEVASAVMAMPVRPHARPERTIRNALRNSPLIAQTRDERYAYTLWLLKGSTLRHVLTDRELSEGSLRLGTDAAYALYPFIYASRRGHTRPCHLYLEEGPLFSQPLERWDGEAEGIQQSYALADWFVSAGCQAGDSLLFEVTDGEEGIYHVFLQRPVPQDEERLKKRNAELAQALEQALARRRAPCYLYKLMPSLVSQGVYHDPYPPLPLETVVQHTPVFRWADGKVSLNPSPPREAQYLPGLSPGGQEPAQPTRGFLRRLFARKQ
jgi:hypothetical protein